MRSIARLVSERGRLEQLPEDLGSPALGETLEALARAGLARASSSGYRFRPKRIWRDFLEVGRRNFDCDGCRLAGLCPLWRILRWSAW